VFLYLIVRTQSQDILTFRLNLEFYRKKVQRSEGRKEQRAGKRHRSIFLSFVIQPRTLTLLLSLSDSNHINPKQERVKIQTVKFGPTLRWRRSAPLFLSQLQVLI